MLRFPRPVRAPLAVLLVSGLALAACTSSPSPSGKGTSSSSTTSAASGSTHGTANLAVAGSLEGLLQTSLQPAFERATGDSVTAKFEGSTALAQAILDKELSPGVFVGVGKKAIKLLWPTRSNFVLTLATDPLVVAYSPHSPDAAQLNAIRSGRKPLKDLFTLMESPGFRLGRTDPNEDPQGGFFELMVQLAEKELHLPAGTAAKILGTTGTTPSTDVGTSSQIYDEDALPTAIQSASVDAGSEYLTEAKQYHLDYITLPSTLDFSDPAKLPLYSTVSLNLIGNVVFQGDLITLNETLVQPPAGQPRTSADQKADEAWMAFLMSSTGQHLLKTAGYVLEAPKLELAATSGTAASVLPQSVLAAYNRLGGSITTS